MNTLSGKWRSRFAKRNIRVGCECLTIAETLWRGILAVKLKRCLSPTLRRWHMISGNPVEKHYDKFCEKYNGHKHILKDAIRDRQGYYHDDVIYEIITGG